MSVLLLVSLSLQAQNQGESRNSFGLNWGMGKIMRQDLIFSPILHEQWSPFNVLVSYRHSHKLEHQVYVKFGRYTPSVTEPFTFYWDTPDELSPSGVHEFNMLDLNYSIGKKIISSNALEMTVGGRSRNRLHQSYYCYGPDWLWHFAYYFSFGLDAWTALSYKVNGSNRFEINLAIPIVSYNARSPYLAQDDSYFKRIYSHKALPALAGHIKEGEWQSWGQSQSLDLDLSYYYALSERWEVGASYWLSMNFNSTPEPFRSVENVLYMNITFKF